MSRATPDDQLKFLLSCVKFSNSGKIDFVEVARECGVVSKGAAAKRYERLLKANGILPGGGFAVEKTLANSPHRAKKSTKAETGQKRKRDEISPEVSKHEGNDEVKTRPPKQERLDVPFMPDPPPAFRPLPYGHMMHPQPPFMHQQVPLFLAQNMRSNMGPLQHQMMSPSPATYNMIPGLPPGGHFMMPNQSTPPFHIPQTVPPPPVQDPNINLNTFEDFYCPDLFNANNLDSMLLSDNASETKVSDMTLLQQSTPEQEQAIPSDSEETDQQVKNELSQVAVPPISMSDHCLLENIKPEHEASEDQNGENMSITASSTPLKTTLLDTAVPSAKLVHLMKQTTTGASEADLKTECCKISKEEDCIFIAD